VLPTLPERLVGARLPTLLPQAAAPESSMIDPLELRDDHDAALILTLDAGSVRARRARRAARRTRP
jgi:hypothetical protein